MRDARGELARVIGIESRIAVRLGLEHAITETYASARRNLETALEPDDQAFKISNMPPDHALAFVAERSLIAVEDMRQQLLKLAAGLVGPSV